MIHRSAANLPRLALCLAGLVSIAAAIPASAIEWSVETSPDIMLFVQGDADASIPLALVEQSVSQVIDYWGIDMGAIQRGGAEPHPLCSLSLYSDWELMAREWDSFDIRGMVMACGLSRLMDRSIPDRGLCSGVWQAAIASGYPEGAWLPIAVHEMTHVLQHFSWYLGPDTGRSTGKLLEEGVAMWSEYALGWGDFYVEAQEPVALWLQEGGSVDRVPGYLVHEVGASIVERCIRLRGPRPLWELCSDTKTVLLGVAGLLWHEPIDFVVAFLDVFGVDWTTFLTDWAAETRLVTIRPGIDLKLRWMREALVLRTELLRPLLCADTLAELDGISRSVVGCTATDADLDRAEALLRRAPEKGAEIDVDALTAREGPSSGMLCRSAVLAVTSSTSCGWACWREAKGGRRGNTRTPSPRRSTTTYPPVPASDLYGRPSLRGEPVLSESGARRPIALPNAQNATASRTHSPAEYHTHRGNPNQPSRWLVHAQTSCDARKKRANTVPQPIFARRLSGDGTATDSRAGRRRARRLPTTRTRLVAATMGTTGSVPNVGSAFMWYATTSPSPTTMDAIAARGCMRRQ